MARVERTHWWYGGLRAMVRQAWLRCALPERPRLLDVGCGTGANIEALALDAEAFGVDFAAEAVTWCRARGLVGTVVGSTLALPFPDACFDVVLSCDVLCHKGVHDKPVAVREMYRVLRPGGVLLLNLPAYHWLLSGHDEAVQNDHRFHRAEVRQLLHAAGFEVAWCSHWNGLLLPLALVDRGLRRLGWRRGSDIAAGTGASVSRPLSAVLTLERRLLSHFALPFGLSIFSIARRARPAQQS